MKNQRAQRGYYSLRSGLTLYPSQDKTIHQILANLVHKAPAHFVLLVDVTGQVIAARGKQDNVDLVALGSLVAGDLAASREIARLTGEYQDYQMILREGQTIHTFIVEAGLHLVFLVQVTTEVPLGWARVLIRKTARQLADSLAAPAEEAEQKKLAQSLTKLQEEALPDLFNDALDELWSE